MNGLRFLVSYSEGLAFVRATAEWEGQRVDATGLTKADAKAQLRTALHHRIRQSLGKGERPHG